MKRSSDHERDPWWLVDQSETNESRPRRRQPTEDRPDQPKSEAAAEAAPAHPEDPVEPELSERLSRPEHRREALVDVLAQLPPELRYRFEQTLAGIGGDWSFERGRHLYLRLVREHNVETRTDPVKVREHFALRRDRPPQPLRESDQRHLVAEAVSPSAARNGELTRARARLGRHDSVQVEVAGLVIVELVPAAPEPSSEPDAPAGEVPEHAGAIAGSEIVQPVNATLDGEVTTTTPESAPAPPTLPDQEIERIIEAVYQEETPPATERVTDIPPAPEPASQSPSHERPAPSPSLESPPESKPAPSAELGPVLAEVTEALDEQVDLPPLAGGSQQRERSPRKRRPDDPTRPSRTRRPTARRESAIRPSRVAETNLLDWERRYRRPEDRPDARMRYQARKLVRVLARRYGLRLTPATEALLMEIVLRPRLVGDRRVYGLGLNRETLLATIRELWLHFPAAAPRINPGIY